MKPCAAIATAGILVLCACGGTEQNPVAVVTKHPIDPNPVSGTWTSSGSSDLAGYTFALFQSADGVLSGTWRGTQIGCTGANCVVTGIITSESTKTGLMVKLFFASDEQKILGFIEGVLVGNDIKGTMYQWWAPNQSDEPDYVTPVELLR
jgi:hypothetical protein